MEIKPGYKSSEFLLTAITLLGGSGLTLGFITIPAADFNQISEWIVQIVGGLAAISALVTYIIGRLSLKKEAVKSAQILPQTETPASGVSDLLTTPGPQYPK